MQINAINSFLNINFKNNNKKSALIRNEQSALFSLNSNPIAYLNKAQISFCAMKKSQFQGIDLIMIERAKLPITKFNSNKDLQEYCQKILDEEYLGKKNLKRLSKSIDRDAKEQKEAILKSWIMYITEENDAYTPAIQLFILSSITKNLSPDTNYLPPTLNKGVLASTIAEIIEATKENRKFNPNFEKAYKNNIQKSIFEKETQLDPSLTGWIKILGKNNDSENFEANVLKLQTLSHNNWCTKTYNAKPYLELGDFWVYLEQGKPKLGVRFAEGEIAEIESEENNGIIPVKYHDVIHSFIDKNEFSVSSRPQFALEDMDNKKEAMDEILSKIDPIALKEKDWESILPALDIEVEKDENGMLILSQYWTFGPEDITLENLGLNEKDLFQKVIKIKGDVSINQSKMEDLGSLEEIGGDFEVYNSELKSLSSLRRIGGDTDFGSECKVESLGDLEYIGGSLTIDSPLITALGNIEEIGRILKIGSDSRISSLGKLKKVGDYVEITNRALKTLGNLEEIKGSLHLNGSSVRSLGELKKVGGSAIFSKKMTNLGKLEYIEKDADFRNTNIINLSNLETIGGSVNFADSKVVDLGKLKHVGGSINIWHSLFKREDFKEVQYDYIFGEDF